MKKLWLTYAWSDNADQNVDLLIGQLQNRGVEVRYDRRQIVPGQRIWPQIDQEIAGADAWAIYLTKNSLLSEPCQEELAYALDRALRTRGSSFPLIGIFPEPADRSVIPSALATRLYVDLQSSNWVEQVIAGVNRAGVAAAPPPVPFVVDFQANGAAFTFTARPLIGRWSPAIVAVPVAERMSLTQVHGLPRSVFDAGGGTFAEHRGEFISPDGVWAGIGVTSPPIDSFHILTAEFSTRPSEILFGGPPEFHSVRPS